MKKTSIGRTIAGICIGAVLVLLMYSKISYHTENQVGDFLTMIGSVAGFLVVILIAVIILRFVVRSGIETAKPPPYVSQFPSQDGPGTYRVEGVDRTTKTETSMDYKTSTAANAKAMGELDGIVVTSVRKV